MLIYIKYVEGIVCIPVSDDISWNATRVPGVSFRVRCNTTHKHAITLRRFAEIIWIFLTERKMLLIFRYLTLKFAHTQKKHICSKQKHISSKRKQYGLFYSSFLLLTRKGRKHNTLNFTTVLHVQLESIL